MHYDYVTTLSNINLKHSHIFSIFIKTDIHVLDLFSTIGLNKVMFQFDMTWHCSTWKTS